MFTVSVSVRVTVQCTMYVSREWCTNHHSEDNPPLLTCRSMVDITNFYLKINLTTILPNFLAYLQRSKCLRTSTEKENQVKCHCRKTFIMSAFCLCFAWPSPCALWPITERLTNFRPISGCLTTGARRRRGTTLQRCFLVKKLKSLTKLSISWTEK